jgi:hypothetical protein
MSMKCDCADVQATDHDINVDIVENDAVAVGSRGADVVNYVAKDDTLLG